jgi:hypothetical protein
MAEYNGQVAEWSNGRNGGMADRIAEWQPNGGMVEWREWLPTYYVMVHTKDDDTFKS